MPRGSSSEVHAYIFIKESLRKMGWIVKNPLRSPDGQVYTQGECLGHVELGRTLGQKKPENVVKVSETEYYVIEAKNERNKIDQALKEAEEYAELINQSKLVSSKIISGVAGNDDEGYIIKSKFLVKGSFEPIISNERELTSFVTPELSDRLLESGINVLEELPINEKVYLETAEKINETLHNGSIQATERGKVVSALLLSLVDDTEPNLNASPSVLINDINARVNAVLQREGKPEFLDYIKISLPTTRENHIKFKQALIKTIQELKGLNIRSAMNSGTDVLGKFYEVFLKYGNWAKEIGIVLTPRHITRFAAEVLDISDTDIVYDPTCGTGGFLVAALDYVKRNYSTEKMQDFKRYNIFGIDQEPSVVAMAIVNMIFRGDGKNNIKESNCFHQWLNLKRIGRINSAEYLSSDSSSRNPPVTKVLMNPPFALKERDEKEYKFVEHAMKQMQDSGYLFTVLPTSEMIAKGQYKKWRKRLLEDNTLIAIITFPTDLFYPIGVNSCGVIIQKGVPHPESQKVLWLRALHDGFVKRKGKRLSPKPPLTEEDIITDYEEKVKSFIKDRRFSIDNVPELCKLQEIDFSDSSLELVPEKYLDELVPSSEEIKEGIENLIRQTAAYLLQFDKKNINITVGSDESIVNENKKLFKITRICDIDRKYAPYKNELLSDQKITPYVTTTESNNGISFKCDTEPNFTKDTVTVALDGTCGTTFYQFEDYIAGEKTAVLSLKESFGVPNDKKAQFLFYLAYIIRVKSWRYHYGRKLSMGRLKEFEIPIPVKNDGSVDYDHIKSLVENCYGWDVIKEYI